MDVEMEGKCPVEGLGIIKIAFDLAAGEAGNGVVQTLEAGRQRIDIVHDDGGAMIEKFL